MQQKKHLLRDAYLVQQLPILPGRFQPSTFGVCELNYRVRHGYGCILTAIATISEGCSFKNLKVVPSKLYRSITEALCLSRVVKS